mmetsp:Transcript_2788/g.6678  ORF Transcript_2788/g.6678 Transcript_2788/m.6678 type:complete len:252 (-) Transcript_2788:254-1009(-)
MKVRRTRRSGREEQGAGRFGLCLLLVSLFDCLLDGLFGMLAVLVGSRAVQSVVIRCGAVVGHVEADVFLLLGDSQDACELHGPEDDRGHAHAPDHDHHPAEDIHAKLLPAASWEEGTTRLVFAVSGVGVEAGTEEPTADEPEEAAAQMHRGGVQGIVDLHLLDGNGHPEFDTSSEKSDDPAGPGLGHGHSRTDCDEATQDAVAEVGQVQVPVLDEAHADGCDAAARSGEGSSHSHLLCKKDELGTQGERGS